MWAGSEREGEKIGMERCIGLLKIERRTGERECEGMREREGECANFQTTGTTRKRNYSSQM
jgi:hypothetical protein